MVSLQLSSCDFKCAAMHVSEKSRIRSRASNKKQLPCIPFGVVVCHGSSMMRICLALLLCGGLLAARCAPDDAFTGYEEKALKCEDALPACASWEKSNQCIENAYYMREQCKKVCEAF
jgi:hypothetical protein